MLLATTLGARPQRCPYAEFARDATARYDVSGHDSTVYFTNAETKLWKVYDGLLEKTKSNAVAGAILEKYHADTRRAQALAQARPALLEGDPQYGEFKYQGIKYRVHFVIVDPGEIVAVGGIPAARIESPIKGPNLDQSMFVEGSRPKQPWIEDVSTGKPFHFLLEPSQHHSLQFGLLRASDVISRALNRKFWISTTNVKAKIDTRNHILYFYVTDLATNLAESYSELISPASKIPAN